MPPLTLEGDTLGKKHQYYNKLVEDAIANKHYELSKISGDAGDLDNLLKIDIASKTRNVDFIIETMKSDDMLYVSRAIKKSTWLITDKQYSNIINPQYLHTELFPNMMSRAVNKWMLHIRLTLKDESRVEAFYEFLKESDEGYKWLENCSFRFIENVLKNERQIPLSLFKRLCKRSVIFLSYYTKVEERSQYAVIREILFLIKNHTADVLNIMEKHHCNPNIGKKYTGIVMKTCPQRILDKFESYVDCIDLSVVANHLNKEEIKSFLYKQLKNDNTKHYFSDYNNLKHFVRHMADDERFEFIKKTFIDKSNAPRPGEYVTFMSDEEQHIPCSVDSYHWYQYAPFNTAFTDLKKLIRAENSPSERCAILSVLITCARRNPQNIKTLVKFYYDKHINEPLKFKLQFVNNILKQTATHEFDGETWNILDQLFHSMEVYTESENNVQMCLKSIILYKVLHDEKVPEIVEKKITFETFKKNQSKLNQEQQDKMFTYLINSVLTKLQNQKIVNECDLNQTVDQLKNAFSLLNDWKKDIKSYPFLLLKIKEIIKIKRENSWQVNLRTLYNMKKSWRKHMFEESLTLNLSEEACLNALKHEPQLLTRYDKEIEALRTNDSVSLGRLLSKLRVYWSHSLAKYWTDAYLQNLYKPTGQKAITNGLFRLLSQKQVIDMAKKYVPEDTKINWGETDQAEISLRKNIAQNLHVARPMTPLETVLWYAKGDYLQYAVPSLNAILYNLSKVQSREHLPKLLEAPVSLQKFGLHLAFAKLTSEELKPIFSKIWTTTRNSTIRAVLFMHTYDLLRKAKNPIVEREQWELLSMFIDNLSSDESKEIYKKLGNAKDIPVSVKADFYMKSYTFLTSLPNSANCEGFLNELLRYAPSIMESLDEDFVVDKLLSPVETKICAIRSQIIDLLASYVLCSKSEEDQLERYRRVLAPAMEQTFQSWNSVSEGEYFVRDNFKQLIRSLIWNFRKFVTLNRITIPAKLFTEIKNKMKEKMAIQESYVLYTSWKLIAEYVKLIDEHKFMLCEFESGKFSESDIGSGWMSEEIEDVWKDIHVKISPTLGPIIVNCLREDTETYFPTICWLFSDAFSKMFDDLSFQRYSFILETLKYMLNDDGFIPSYLVVCNEIPKYGDDEVRRLRSTIREKITAHPSEEVQMHYHKVFGDIPEDTF